jgi:hypothetical protein
VVAELNPSPNRTADLCPYRLCGTTTWFRVSFCSQLHCCQQRPCTRGAQVVGKHPNVLAYSVAARLRPAIEYLQEIGVTDIAAVITERPSLLGLDPEQQLRRVVDYFKANGYSQEEIIELVSKSI